MVGLPEGICGRARHAREQITCDTYAHNEPGQKRLCQRCGSASPEPEPLLQGSWKKNGVSGYSCKRGVMFVIPWVK